MRRHAFVLPLALLATLATAPAAGQAHGHQGPAAHRHHGTGHGPSREEAAPARPYEAVANRRVRALPETQAADLLAGRGMGLALAAESNGYPGPMHVLEHAEALGLSPEQRVRAEALKAAVGAEARAIGARIVALEEELDALFARGEADPGRLAALTAALGALGGRLREAHLAAHIGMREALSPGQRAAYAKLRGHARN